MCPVVCVCMYVCMYVCNTQSPGAVPLEAGLLPRAALLAPPGHHLRGVLPGKIIQNHLLGPLENR